MAANDRTYGEIIEAYKHIKGTKDNFGFPRKTLFHIHTPASYDYEMFGKKGENEYKNISEKELEDIVYEKEIIPQVACMGLDEMGEQFLIYKNKKEFYAYLLIAHELLINEYEIVVVADHNTFDGIDKLKLCVEYLKHTKSKKYKVFANIFRGIEISCADKLHIVAIVDGKEKESGILKWLKDKLISERDGIYATSLVAMEELSKKGAITYIAHIYSSDINKESSFSGGYKKKLFSSENTRVVGLKNKNQIESANNFLNNYRKGINYLIDNDSHSIDTLSENYFWIKGSKISFQMLKEAMIDFDISVSYDNPNRNKVYIEGLYVMYEESGFLSNMNKNGDFTVKFSDSLNCLIGGRGTGKSTVLEIIDFVMTQIIHDDKLLDFICWHGKVYLLFRKDEDEYIVEFSTPYREDNKDINILSCFEDEKPYRYDRKYHFDPDNIKKYMSKNLIKLYKINSNGNNTITKDNICIVKNKTQVLSELYDNRYSVNDLVKYASGEEINSFIYNLMFKNKKLDTLDKKVRFSTVSGLLRFLKGIDDTLMSRKKEIKEVIEPFNDTQKNILEIQYIQNDFDFEYPLDVIYSKKFDNISKKYNIKRGQLKEFMSFLIDKKGLIDFLKSSIDNDFSWIDAKELLEFTQPSSIGNINLNKEVINKSKAKIIVTDLIKYAADEDNLKIWIAYFKKYFGKIEEYTILFNINSKEDSKTLSKNFKDTRQLSLGQKVVAMLDFIFGYGEYSNDFRPIVIDQPEDNLDSRYIYKNLVQQLRKTKSERQVIIATHSATIVTNAMADSVIVMESDGVHGWVKKQGYPGEVIIKKEIINHMEGGIDSFNHKMLIYKEALGG
ncbi:Spaf_1101 family AAA-like ATPase [uncultured Anaerococcus sp.]|uniref:Spaf_1101 family AAA-like ATPase n=1 Tax=uncultured Anaerococcus sp. TaxID=293428 RepID=UPI0026156ED9|nr:AAA family ATPase [uncultured Anaerococcus sp.]